MTPRFTSERVADWDSTLGLAWPRYAAFAPRTVIRRLLALLIVTTSAFAASPDASSVVAGHAEISVATGESILTGNPRVDYGDLRLTADEIRLNPKTHIAKAIGHAVMTKGPRRLLADVITYHADTETYEVGELRMGEYPVYVTGTSATGGPTQVTVNNAEVSLSEPGSLIPTLHAAQLFFTSDNKLHALKASVGLGSIRPLSVSGFDHNVHRPLISHVALTGGFRRSLGVFLQAGVQIPVTEDLHLGADIGLYSARGIMAGPAGSYNSVNGTTEYDGFFRSGFISDYGTRLTDVLGRPVPKNRGFAEWQHRQTVGERTTIVADLNYWRDSEIVRDFRPSEFFRVQQPDTFIEAAYAGDNYFLSFFTRAQPNSFHMVQQRLPELRFDLVPLALGGGLVEQFSASVVALREDALPAGPLNVAPGVKRSSDRLDAYYSLSRPIRPTDWLTFTPVAGGRVTHYSNIEGAQTNSRDNYTRLLGEVGFDAELRASGVYDYKNPRWKIDGLRHLLTPKLSYRYIPDAEKGARYIPPIDRQSFSTYLQPLGLGAIRNIDELHGTNTLRLGIDNTLQTRDPVYGSRDLVVFNVANDFRFHRTLAEKDVSEIHTELGIMPARWLELGVYQSFVPQTLTLREINTGVTLRDGDEWMLRFSSNFLRRRANDGLPGNGEPLNDYFLEGSRRLNEAFEGIVHLRYDARRQRFNEQIYGIRQNISNTWSVEYAISLYGGQRRESRFGFNVRIDALRF